jgi:hypothetical protein
MLFISQILSIHGYAKPGAGTDATTLGIAGTASEFLDVTNFVTVTFIFVVAGNDRLLKLVSKLSVQ